MNTPSRRPGRFIPGVDTLEGRRMLSGFGEPPALVVAVFAAPNPMMSRPLILPVAMTSGPSGFAHAAGDRPWLGTDSGQGGGATPSNGSVPFGASPYGETGFGHGGMDLGWSPHNFSPLAPSDRFSSSSGSATPALTTSDATQAQGDTPSQAPSYGVAQAPTFLAMHLDLTPLAQAANYAQAPPVARMAPPPRASSNVETAPDLAGVAANPQAAIGNPVAIPEVATASVVAATASAGDRAAGTAIASPPTIGFGSILPVPAAPATGWSNPRVSPDAPTVPGSPMPRIEPVPGPGSANSGAGAEVVEARATIVVPPPVGADLISEVGPVDQEAVDRALSWLIERVDGADERPDPQADLMPVATVVAGSLALEAARRWRNRKTDVVASRLWTGRSSSLRGFF